MCNYMLLALVNGQRETSRDRGLACSHGPLLEIPARLSCYTQALRHHLPFSENFLTDYIMPALLGTSETVGHH